MLRRPVLQISHNIVNHTLSMGRMKSDVERVGVIINANVLSVRDVHARGGFNARNAYAQACSTEHAVFLLNASM